MTAFATIAAGDLADKTTFCPLFAILYTYGDDNGLVAFHVSEAAASGLAVGYPFVVSGSTSYNGTYTVYSIESTVLVYIRAQVGDSVDLQDTGYLIRDEVPGAADDVTVNHACTIAANTMFASLAFGSSGGSISASAAYTLIDLSAYTANSVVTANYWLKSLSTLNTIVASDYNLKSLSTLNTIVASDYTANTIVAADYTANSVVTANYWLKSLSTLNTVVASDFTANTVVASDFTANTVVASDFTANTIVTANYWLKSLSTLNTVVASDYTANTIVTANYWLKSLSKLVTAIVASADVRYLTPRWTGATGLDIGTMRLAAGTAIVDLPSPVQEDGRHLVLVQGETYSGNDIRLESDDWEPLVDCTVKVWAIYKDTGTQAATVDATIAVAGAGTQAIQIPLPESISTALHVGHRHIAFVVWAAYATRSRPLRRGDISVSDDCRA